MVNVYATELDYVALLRYRTCDNSTTYLLTVSIIGFRIVRGVMMNYGLSISTIYVSLVCWFGHLGGMVALEMRTLYHKKIYHKFVSEETGEYSG